MKRILITGKNSYIGTSVEKWLIKEPDKYQVHSIDLKNEHWKEHNFSTYDIVFHVAGIAHVSADSKMKELYYKVNRDLTIEVAKKAKADGVKQFIFMSSMIVYGESGRIGEEKVITKETIPQPTDFYGDSKLQAEKGIQSLQSKNFNIAIIRPPMIYGKGSKGNYPKLAKLARVTPIFPAIENKRSMLHIDNLCEFIKLIVDLNEKGIYFPQNSEYISTSELVYTVGKYYNKKILLTEIFNLPLKLFSKKVKIINKIFGNSVYDKNISTFPNGYQIRCFEETIERTEK